MSALDDFRFWMQTFEDARRTVLCPPGLGDKVRAVIDQHGVGGLYDVQESRACSDPDRILMVDHNALDAIARQGIQRISGRADVDPWTAGRHQHGMDCCRDCFDGLHVHPELPGDPTCKDRADGNGRCTYAETSQR